MRRADYVFKRAFFALITIFVAITLNFFLFRVLPGNAATSLARVPHAGAKLRHALTVEFGLDKPKWQQYVLYLRELVHGNLGVSYVNQQPVASQLWTALKNTIPMVTAGTLLSIIVGVFTGVLAAWRRGSIADHISTNAAVFAYAFPTQWIGLMLLIWLARYLPSNGMSWPILFSPEPFWQHLADVAQHMILPALTLFLTAYGSYTLVVRTSVLETLGDDYVLTARAKGLPVRRIVWRHAVRNALLPMVTMIAMDFGYIVGGVLLVEVIFSWPGIGLAMENAILDNDYPMLEGGFLVLSVAVIALNFLSDLVYFRLDPRITE
jgi:ABC-type dipeptide/oligopeptide/nickel transport system permease component